MVKSLKRQTRTTLKAAYKYSRTFQQEVFQTSQISRVNAVTNLNNTHGHLHST